jgi:hypothetical protein
MLIRIAYVKAVHGDFVAEHHGEKITNTENLK